MRLHHVLALFEGSKQTDKQCRVAPQKEAACYEQATSGCVCLELLSLCWPTPLSSTQTHPALPLTRTCLTGPTKNIVLQQETHSTAQHIVNKAHSRRCCYLWSCSGFFNAELAR